MNEKIILAVPKGRILEELKPLFKKVGIIPQKEFFIEGTRLLQFSTNHKNIDIIKVRSFDVVTFVAFGAASLGIAGSDVIEEFANNNIYAPVNLGIGKCRISVAASPDVASGEDISRWSHIRVATKYPNITKNYFAQRGVQAECIKLNGAMELAPKLGLCRRIVDLVSSGRTLKENGLVEICKITDVASYLIVNRTAFKTNNAHIVKIIEDFRNP